MGLRNGHTPHLAQLVAEVQRKRTLLRRTCEVRPVTAEELRQRVSGILFGPRQARLPKAGSTGRRHYTKPAQCDEPLVMVDDEVPEDAEVDLSNRVGGPVSRGWAT